MTAPVLETARLRLRNYRAGDLEEEAQTLGDPEVARFLGGKTLSREEAWRKLLCGPGLWALVGYGYWAVERKSDGRLIGKAGFADFKREMTPSIEGIPEIGWIFSPHAQGQGYATEAVAAALKWSDEVLKADEVTAIIDHANAASIRVAEKNGFSDREEASYRGEPILLFRRKRPRT